MKVAVEFDKFQGWGDVPERLEEVRVNNLQDKLEAHLEEIFGDEVEEGKLNDYLQYEFEEVKEAIGLKDEDEDEELEESVSLFQRLNAKIDEALS